MARQFKPYLIALFTIGTLHNTYADTSAACPPDMTPGGSLSYLSVLDANGPIACMNTGWWYVVGLLNDDHHQQHSLQINLFRQRLIGGVSAGAGAIGFTYHLNGKQHYLWSSYPDDMLTSVGSFNAKPTTKDQFDVQASASNMNYHFYHDPTDMTHKVGQLGARYILNAQGIGHIDVTQLKPLNGKKVSFNAAIYLTDQRGLLPEGENGFIGTSSAKNSWEFAAPNLKVTRWSLSITPQGNAGGDNISFSGDNHQDNRMWYDRQVLYKKESTNTQRQIQGNETLYRGTWMSFCLDQQPYKGYCGVATAFWQNGVATRDMDSSHNAFAGFINLYTPMNDNSVGNQITEIIPLQNTATAFKPYRIQNDPDDTFNSALSPNTYERSVYLSVDPRSSTGALLHLAQTKHEAPLLLKFTTLSPLTENIMFNPNNAFYEGAAKVYRCKAIGDCDTSPAGSAFVEQMGYNR